MGNVETFPSVLLLTDPASREVMRRLAAVAEGAGVALAYQAAVAEEVEAMLEIPVTPVTPVMRQEIPVIPVTPAGPVTPVLRGTLLL
jgi:hypothetical protein